MRQNIRRKLRELSTKVPQVGTADNLDWYCVRFVKMLHKDYRGHKSEITAREYVQKVAWFSSRVGIDSNLLLSALQRRNWIEPSAGETYVIRYDLAGV